MTWHIFSNKINWDFPSDLVVKTLPSNVGEMGSIPGQGATITHAMGCGQISKQKSCNAVIWVNFTLPTLLSVV